MKAQYDPGCHVYSVIFQKAEILVLENKWVRFALVPEYGAAAIEYRYKPLDCNMVWRTPMWQQNLLLKSYAPGAQNAIGDTYLGGWFDVFPCFGHGFAGEGEPYANHGELSYLPWSYDILEESSQRIRVRLHTFLSHHAVKAERTLTLEKDSTRILEELTVCNIGPVPVPYHWAFHPTLGKPFLSSTSRIYLGGRDLGTFPEEGSCISRILSYEDLKEPGFRVVSPDAGLSITAGWDLADFPHGSVWTNSGYSYGNHCHLGGYCLCILPRDTLDEGVDDSTEQKLQPGQSRSTWIWLEAQPLEA